MGSEEGGFDHGPAAFPDSPNHPKHLQFVLGGQPVAAFDFDRSGSHPGDFIHPGHGLTVKFFLAGAMQQVGGIENSSSARGDFRIAQTLDLVDEFLFPGACKADMGVRIAERRQHMSASGVDDFVFRADLRQGGHRSERINVSAPDGQIGIAQG